MCFFAIARCSLLIHQLEWIKPDDVKRLSTQDRLHLHLPEVPSPCYRSWSDLPSSPSDLIAALKVGDPNFPRD